MDPRSFSSAAQSRGDDAVKKPKKLSYKYERELKKLPDKIKKVEASISRYNEQLADPDFYSRDPGAFHEMTQDLAEAENKLERYENRWLELEDMRGT